MKSFKPNGAIFYVSIARNQLSNEKNLYFKAKIVHEILARTRATLLLLAVVVFIITKSLRPNRAFFYVSIARNQLSNQNNNYPRAEIVQKTLKKTRAALPLLTVVVFIIEKSLRPNRAIFYFLIARNQLSNQNNAYFRTKIVYKTLEKTRAALPLLAVVVPIITKSFRAHRAIFYVSIAKNQLSN